MPLALWRAVADAAGASFADSYLARAVVVGRTIHTKTTIAAERLRMSRGASQAIRNMAYHVQKPEGVRPWRPLTEEEYQSASLSDRIDHHEKMAHIEFNKAGPMWKDGRPARPDELPERWHTHTAAALSHRADVQRLRQIMAEQPAR